MFYKVSFLTFVVLTVISPFSGAFALDFEPKSISLTSLSPGCKNFDITEIEMGGISAQIGKRKQRRKKRRCKLGFQVQSELNGVSPLICRRFQAYLYRFRGERDIAPTDSTITRVLESDECGGFSYTLRTRKRKPREERWHIALESMAVNEPKIPYVVVPPTGKVCLQVLTCGLNVATGEVAIYSNSCGVDGEKVVRASSGACGMGGVSMTLDK